MPVYCQVGNFAADDRLAFGFSFMSGRYSDQERNVVAFKPVRIERVETIAYQEHGLGIDASLDRGPLRLRAEAIVRSIRYEEGKRETAWADGIYWADHVEWDTYILAAYRLPWAGLEPYAYAELYHWPTTIGDKLLLLSPGLNIHFNTAVMAKIQYVDSRWISGGAPEYANNESARVLATRLVVAF